MSRPLSDAVRRAQRRRLRETVRRRPVVMGLAAVAWVAGPVVAWRLGSTVAASLAPASVDISTARALVLGLGLTCAAVGAAVMISMPGVRALGTQVVAALVPRRELVLAVTVPVLTGATMLVGPAAAALVVSLASGISDSPLAPLGLALALLAATGAGALFAEAALALRVRQRMPGAGLVIACLTALLAVETGARTASAAVLPLAVLIVVTCAAGAGSCALWLALFASRPERLRRRRRAPMLAPCRTRSASVAASAVALLWRPAELRLALVAATLFGLAGVAVGTLSGAPPAAGLLLGGGSCAVAGCLVPLSARGRIDPGAWAWRLAGRARVALAWSLAALALMAAALLPVSLVAGVQDRGATPVLAQVLAIGVFMWCCALIGGALVPRRAHGAGDDALSLGALGAAAITLGSASAAAGARLTAGGIPDPVAGGLLLAALFAAATTMLGVLWGRR